ncbi:hypothetical protein OGAPHI_000326 [Ogataea philodendri]|uniref:Transcription initiation factor TFIID subunit 8 n=2 Tax=Saccharomycotina TaxID=147537 RepID=A0A9P8PG23_9ASCO|nr:uncharacterized protein OGAPHI_000326 [Ogataea philodendri]KAH3671623.1 hypothetical protein OGAPHI_000326 [Ogataea philodendri]
MSSATLSVLLSNIWLLTTTRDMVAILVNLARICLFDLADLFLSCKGFSNVYVSLNSSWIRSEFGDLDSSVSNRDRISRPTSLSGANELADRSTKRLTDMGKRFKKLNYYLFMAEEIQTASSESRQASRSQSPQTSEPDDKLLVSALLAEIQKPSVTRMDLAKDIPIERVKIELDPMDTLLESCIGLFLSYLGIEHVTRSALNQLTLLAVTHIDQIYSQLHKVTEIQRRRQPSKGDLKVLESLGVIDFNDVYDALQVAKNIDKTKVQKIEKKAAKLCEILDRPAEDDILTEQDPAFVFFNDTSAVISQVVPPTVGEKSYIPSWMPPLPPDHTYRATPKYTAIIDNPIKMREQLVQEARLGEKALHHILDLKENVVPVEKGDSEPEVETDVSSESEQKEPVYDDVPDSREGKFNIAEFAKKRLATLEKRRSEKEKLYKKRVESQEAVLGRTLGFYTQSSSYPSGFHQVLGNLYDETYEQVISGLRSQQKRRAKQIEEDKKRVETNHEEIKIPEFTGEVHEDDFDMDDFEFDEVLEETEKALPVAVSETTSQPEPEQLPLPKTTQDPADDSLDEFEAVFDEVTAADAGDDDIDMDLFE